MHTRGREGRRRAAVPATALVAGIAAAAASCAGHGGGDPQPISESPLIAEAEQQREIWAAHHIAGYRLTVERVCFCVPEYRGPFVSTVEGVTAIEVVHEATGKAVSEGVLTGLPVTVEQLFDTIEEFADADSIEVRYDPEFGYPSAIVVDPSESAVDEEVSYFVRGFQPQG